MSTSELVEEADRVAIAYQVALAKIGAETTLSAIRSFQRLNATQVDRTASAWLDDAVQLITTKRGQSRDLAMAYYRLARALRTGRTIADPRNPDPPYVTLSQLRREFRLLIESRTGEGPTGSVDQQWLRGIASTLEADDDDLEVDPRRIEVETVPGLDADDDSRRDADAEREARVALTILGPEGVRRKVDAVRKSAERAIKGSKWDIAESEIVDLINEAHDEQGAQVGASAARQAMNGARGLTTELAESDSRVIGYVRTSTTGTPCGWCAMLISRGLVFYESKRSATAASGSRGSRADGAKFHDNCKCVALEVYSRQQYLTSNLYAMNRRYAIEWPRVTKGLSGKQALAKWRAYIRAQRLTGSHVTQNVLLPGVERDAA